MSTATHTRTAAVERRYPDYSQPLWKRLLLTRETAVIALTVAVILYSLTNVDNFDGPLTLKFLLQFNVWLNIEPTMRITDWMSFATILPLVFGVAFQTPLIMLFLERIGILTADDFRAKRKLAILVIVAAAAILTPGPDVFSQAALAVPMIALYELGILMMGANKKSHTPAVVS